MAGVESEGFGGRLLAMNVEELETLVRHHDRLYWEENAPQISDPDYDALVRRLTELAPRSALLSRIGGGGEAARERLGDKVSHAVPMLSLEKCYADEALLAWAEGVEGTIMGSPKIDGMAVEIRYDAQGNLAQAVTRGDGFRGDDVTANVREIPGIPRKLPGSAFSAAGPQISLLDAPPPMALAVRGEIYAPLSAFVPFADRFQNPRNFAAGSVKQKDGAREQLKALSFFAYDLLGPRFASEEEKRRFLEELGHRPVWGESLRADEMPAFAARVLARRDELDYELDGVVFKAARVAEQERLGATAHHPRFAIAYKFQGESGSSTLERVDWQVARTGTITPVAIIAPIRLSGATVARCSLHNLNVLAALDLKVGDKVVAMRRGGVIPHIEASLGGGQEPVVPPSRCPSCGEATIEEDGFLRCSDAGNCVAASLGMLEHFAKVVELDGFGQRIIELLREGGLLVTPADFYRLRAEDLRGMERMGEVLIAKLLGNVAERRRLPLALLLQSLGIREVGRQVAQAIAGSFETVEALKDASAEALAEVDGVGPVIAANVARGLTELSDLIKDLMSFVEIEAPRADTGAALSGSFAGRSVLFTGKLRSIGRKEAQALVTAAGGQTPAQVTKELDVLVVGDEGSALFGEGTKGSKLKRAEKLQKDGSSVEIISETEFFKRLDAGASVPPESAPSQGKLEF